MVEKISGTDRYLVPGECLAAIGSGPRVRGSFDCAGRRFAYPSPLRMTGLGWRRHYRYLRASGASDSRILQIGYAGCMNHLEVLREKIGLLRAEIAEIQELNERYRRHERNEPHAQVAHGQRQERLQAIQQELSQLAGLGRKVRSIEEMKQEHRARLHPVKNAS